MTSASKVGSRHWPVDEEVTPSPLGHYFDDAEQRELLDEDYVAGRNVARELISVFAAAILMGIFALLWISLSGR